MDMEKPVRNKLPRKNVAVLSSAIILLTVYMGVALYRKGYDAMGLFIMYIWVIYKLLSRIFQYTHHYSFPDVHLKDNLLFAMFLIYIVILGVFAVVNEHGVGAADMLFAPRVVQILSVDRPAPHERDVVNAVRQDDRAVPFSSTFRPMIIGEIPGALDRSAGIDP